MIRTLEQEGPAEEWEKMSNNRQNLFLVILAQINAYDRLNQP